MVKWTIKKWATWINNDEQEGFQDMKGVDPFSEKWIVQINRASVAWTFTADWDIYWFTEFLWKLYLTTQDWWANNSQIWESSDNWSTWTKKNDNTYAWNGWDLIVYHWYMYYSSDKYIWRTVDASWFTDDFFDLWTTVNIQPHLFVVFQDNLYVTNWYQIRWYDWTSWDTTDFVVPEDETIISITKIWDEIAFWTDKWTLRLWDWTNTAVNKIIDTNLWPMTAIVEIDNQLFIFAWIYWVIYRYTWADLEPYITIPEWNVAQWTSWQNSTSVKQNWVSPYKNWIVFKWNQNETYLLSRNDDKEPYWLVIYWDNTFATTSSNLTIPVVYMQGSLEHDDWLVIWYWDSDIDIVNPTWARYAFWTDINDCNAYIDLPLLDISSDEWKEDLVSWIQCFLKDVTSNQSVRVWYKLDWATSFTEISTAITEDNHANVINEIEQVWNIIEFRLALWDWSWNNTRLTQFKYF